MSRAWTQVGVRNIPAALAILETFARDKLREFETRLLDEDWDPDEIDRLLAEQQDVVDHWIAGVRAEVCNGVADVSDRDAHL